MASSDTCQQVTQQLSGAIRALGSVAISDIWRLLTVVWWGFADAKLGVSLSQGFSVHGVAGVLVLGTE
jgi:hypothetical protein